MALFSPGETVAEKYVIDSVLGVGGMGVVYLARHRELNGRVALKFLSAAFLGSPEAIERFRREAQAAAKLDSEHVVRVFDVGTHPNGLPYMVMEHLQGSDLGIFLATSGPLSIDLAARLLIQTCSAVEDAHRHGVIHRDLKPSNLFCVPSSDGSLTIKVVDFGISKLTGESTSQGGITVTGNIIGSPSYMSPEQMRTPNRIDHRSDIWSLGVVLYECLTGKLPFPGSTYAEICLKVHQDPPLPASLHGVQLPPGLEAVINKCLAKEPEQRYGAARELAAALLEYVPHSARARGSAVGSMPTPNGGRWATPSASGKVGGFTGTHPGWVQPAATSRTRLRLSLVLSAASALVALGTVVGWLLFRSDPVHAISAALPSASAHITPATAAMVSRHEHQEAPSPLPSLSGAPVHERVVAPTVAPTPPTPQVLPSAAPFSSAATAGSAGSRPPTRELKPAAKTTPARPATERDPKSSIWTR